MVQADIVEVGRVAVDTGDDMTGNSCALKSTNVLGGTSLAGAVEGDECHAHSRKRRLLKPAAACTRIPMELKYQWHGLVRDGFKVLGMQRAPHMPVYQRSKSWQVAASVTDAVSIA